jgi:hypothetical protein
MNPINTRTTPAKPDINHSCLFKEEAGLCPRVVNSSTTPPLVARKRSGKVVTQYQKSPIGEKKKSDKNRNKTQQLMHLSGRLIYIIPKPVTYSYLTHLYDGYKPVILLYLPLSDFIKQTPIHA